MTEFEIALLDKVERFVADAEKRSASNDSLFADLPKKLREMLDGSQKKPPLCPACVADFTPKCVSCGAVLETPNG